MPFYQSDSVLIRRDEFERRMSEMNDRVSRVEMNTEKRFDALGNKIDQMQAMLSTMQTFIERNSTSRWQWIAGVTISFVVGGGGIYISLALGHAIK